MHSEHFAYLCILLCDGVFLYSTYMLILHRKKKVREFPVPSRDVTLNNDVMTELFLPRGSLVSDIPAGDGKLVNLFLLCSWYWPRYAPFFLGS